MVTTEQPQPQCLIIAEAGVNHNGSEELALALIAAAAETGADAVKFQTFSAKRLVRLGAPKAAYQERETGSGDQYSMLRALELADDAYPRLQQSCREHGIEFMSTPFDREAADLLINLGMRRLKIPSGEITNLPFLRNLAERGLPMILSSGMSTLEEVAEAVAAIRHCWKNKGIVAPPGMLTLLHCTSNYPTAMEDVNLRAMQTMADHFGLAVGYSDHTAGVEVPVAAVALGAKVIEKHFTLDHQLPGPDQKASLEPDEFARMVREIRHIELALGNGVKAPKPTELPVRELVRRSVTLLRPLPAGSILQPTDLDLLRPGTGIPPKSLEETYGRVLSRDLPAGSTLTWDDLLP